MLKVIVKNYGIYSDLTRSHKIKSTFYNESTLRKLLSKPKDRVAAKDKNNIFYENDCSNCKAVYFGKSKRYLKSRSDEHKKSVRNCDCEKNEIAKHCWEADHNFSWDQKEVIDRESRLIRNYQGKLRKLYILRRILITLTKFPTWFQKYSFLIYVSS